jgi:hypothetical protein
MRRKTVKWSFFTRIHDGRKNSPANTDLTSLHVEDVRSSGISGGKVIIFNVGHDDKLSGKVIEPRGQSFFWLGDLG